MVNVSPVKLPVHHHTESLKASITSKLESVASVELESPAAELGSKIKTCINRRKQTVILNYSLRQNQYLSGLNWVVKHSNECLFAGGAFDKLFLIRLGMRYSDFNGVLSAYSWSSHQLIGEFSSLCGLVVDDKLVVGCAGFVQVYTTSGQHINQIKCKETANKIIRIDDQHVLVAETEGVVEVLPVAGKKRVSGYQIDGETQI